MHRSRAAALLLTASLVLLGACSSDTDEPPADTALGDAPTTTTAPKPVDAVLVPAEGPLQAGTYAVPGFDPLLSLELPEAWTVIVRNEGSLTLAYEFDPEGRELARLNIHEVPAAFDEPFIPIETMQVPSLQQARRRPLPRGGLAEALRTLPGVTLTEPVDVDVAGVDGRRFTARVGELPAEAKTICPQIPTGCVVAYDLPGGPAALFVGGTTHDLTTFEIGGTTYLAAVNAPSTGPPSGFEEAAQAVIRSLSVDRPVRLDATAVRGLFLDAIADPKLRPFARSATAPGSPAATFMAALADDYEAQTLAGNELPVRTVTTAGAKATITGGPATEEYDSFTDELGRVASFRVQGRPIAEFIAAVDTPVTLEVGPLRVTPLEVYRSFVSGRLWIPVRVVNGDAEVNLAGLVVTHVAADGTERPTSQPVGELVVPAFNDAPFTLLFEDAPLDGKLVFSGSIGGKPVEATFEIPAAG
jgi:hypothetical protein